MTKHTDGDWLRQYLDEMHHDMRENFRVLHKKVDKINTRLGDGDVTLVRLRQRVDLLERRSRKTADRFWSLLSGIAGGAVLVWLKQKYGGTP